MANTFVDLAGRNPLLALIVVFGLTTIFTEVMTNNAAAALMFPVSMATASTLEVNFMPFVMAVMVAASCSGLSATTSCAVEQLGLAMMPLRLGSASQRSSWWALTSGTISGTSE